MNNEIIEVEEYEVVKSLKERVAEIKAIEAMVYKVTIEAVIQIGHQLKLCKEEVPHGEWSNWCEENLGYSQRQAQKYMELSERYSDETGTKLKTNTYSFLSISKAYELLSLPEEEAEKFVEDHDIDNMTVKSLQEEIKNKTDELEMAQREVEAGKALVTTFDAKLEERDGVIRDLKGQLEELKSLPMPIADEEELKAKEETINKLEEALKKAKENQVELEKEKEAAEARAKEEVKRKLEEVKEDTNRKIAEAVKKASITSDPAVAEFKIRVDILQNEFNACVNSIDEIEDIEMKIKFRNALEKVMDQLKERI